MSLKKLGLALVAVLAIGAVMVSSASAAATTTAAKWYTGATEGGVTELTGSQAITAAIIEHPEIGNKTRLNATVGLSNTPITLTATAIACESCKIENKAVTSKAGTVAFGEGKVKFTGVTVDTPATCAVEGGTVLTNLLNVHGDFMEGEKAMLQFRPPTGEEFASFKLINGSGSCGPAGTYVVKGSLFAEAENKTGKAAKVQNVKFSPAINKAAGGELKIGSKIAELTGSAKFEAGGNFFSIK